MFFTGLLHRERELREYLYNNVIFEYSSEVNIFSPFYSLGEIYSAFEAIFIKPLICLALSLGHAMMALFDWSLMLARIMTLSRNAHEPFMTGGTHLILSFIEVGACLHALLTESLSFTMRCSVTLGVGAYNLPGAIANLFWGNQKYRFSKYRFSETETIHSDGSNRIDVEEPACGRIDSPIFGAL